MGSDGVGRLPFRIRCRGAPPIICRLGTRYFLRRRAETRATAEQARETGAFVLAFRVRNPKPIAGLPAKAKSRAIRPERRARLTGVFYEITERKQLEARLLALNETLEARVAQVQEEARTLEILNRTGSVLASELSPDRLVQSVS